MTSGGRVAQQNLSRLREEKCLCVLWDFCLLPFTRRQLSTRLSNFFLIKDMSSVRVDGFTYSKIRNRHLNQTTIGLDETDQV